MFNSQNILFNNPFNIQTIILNNHRSLFINKNNENKISNNNQFNQNYQ